MSARGQHASRRIFQQIFNIEYKKSNIQSTTDTRVPNRDEPKALAKPMQPMRVLQSIDRSQQKRMPRKKGVYRCRVLTSLLSLL
jgi:hypothetical protein